MNVSIVFDAEYIEIDSSLYLNSITSGRCITFATVDIFRYLQEYSY